MARTNNFLAMIPIGVIVLSAACGSKSSSSDAGPTDAGQPPADAGPSDAGAADAGSTHDAGVPSSTTATLDTVTAHVVGRRGRDVQLTIAGHDMNKSIAAVMVRLLDSSGTPVLGFDSHQSGNLDSELGPATFATAVYGAAMISTTALLPGMAASQPTVASVAVSLRDIAGASSNEITVPVTAQTTAQNGESCDATYVASRCVDTFFCTGSPATCAPAPSPAISQLAYLTTDAGSTILVKGTEQSDNLANLNIGFLDGGGQPLGVPLDGDNSSPVTSFDSATAATDSNGGLFMVVIQPASDFSQLCQQIQVTPSDATGLSGNPLTTRATAIPVRGVGVACDTQGFDTCSAGNVCTLSASGSGYLCAGLATTQSAACKAAPALSPTGSGGVTTFAHTGKASLWNPPDGCSSNDPTNHPVGLATLHLANAAASVTLSTDNPGTDFDTVLYVLPSCAATSVGALGCNDDAQDGMVATSTLTLTNLGAGDYTVVIGSFDAAGGNYELTATVP